MATGTGKTFIALECLRRCFEEERGLVAVLAFPFSHLLRQWIDDFEEFGITTPLVVVDSSNPRWRKELPDVLMDVRLGHVTNAAILTTHDSLASEDLIGLIRQHCRKAMIVVDEVHGIGAPTRRLGLLETYTWRLGLSATPDRWFDPEGTTALKEFFGETVFRFTLRQAIRTVNPVTRQSFLTPYVYLPQFVDLTGDETEE